MSWRPPQKMTGITLQVTEKAKTVAKVSKPRTPAHAEQLERITKMWHDGLLMEVIAARIGMTEPGLRSLVCKYRHVLGYRKGGNVGPPSPKQKAVAKVKSLVPPIRPVHAKVKAAPKADADFVPGLDQGQAASAPMLPGKPLTLIELTNSSCRWPVWKNDYAPRLYCGAYAPGTGSYCDEHRRRAFTPRTCERAQNPKPTMKGE